MNDTDDFGYDPAELDEAESAGGGFLMGALAMRHSSPSTTPS